MKNEIEKFIPKTAKFVKVNKDRYGNNTLTYDPMTNEYLGEWASIELPKGDWQIVGSYEYLDKIGIELIKK